MITKEVNGYSKQKAYEKTELSVEFEMLKNATQAWKKAGAPIRSKDLTAFMAAYLKDKKAAGAYIVVDAASDDTRLRPYAVLNEVTTGKRKTKTFYHVTEADVKFKEKTVTYEGGVEGTVLVGSASNLGATIAKYDKKNDAIKGMKELIEAENRDYVIEIKKDVVEGQPFAAYGKYTPSKSAKEGKFIFFTNEA